VPQVKETPAVREQLRTVTSFLLSAPCSKCGLTNPAAAVACWQCGAPLKTRSIYRICPSCDCPLTEEPTPVGTQIDACLRCGGVWFEAGEMSVLFQLGPQAINDLQKRLMAGRSGPSGHGTLVFMAAKCPGCHYMMERRSFAGVDDLKIDVCSNCKGVWLDGGELGRAYALISSGATLQASSAPSDAWGSAE
jgi:Zn-finger nucleic acid-binding protein